MKRSIKTRCESTTRSGDDDAGVAALRSLARALLPFLHEEIARENHEHDLVDVLEHVPGPKRSLMRACRTGTIAGASKVGRRWLATRGAIDRYLRGHEAVAANRDDELAALRARLQRGLQQGPR